ncbi:MAG TPA: iron ABC transporter permease [Casimicrobiaceae bacterium]|nr:iron ABC transporter permease [Casimicrobiaceae bacterium]
MSTVAHAGDVPAAARGSSIGVRDAARVVTLGLAVAALLLFIGYPLCWLLFGAVGLPGDFSPRFLVRALTQPGNLTALANTAVLAVGVGLSSVALGVPVAWATARTDVPMRKLLHALVGLAYILPPYLTSVAYIILLGPNAGYLNRLFASTTGMHGSVVNIFSAGGVTFVIAMHVYAIPYFLVYGALQSVDPSLEESARMLGAPRWTMLRRITLPLVAPAISGGALLAAIDSMALFGPQAFLGLPAQVVYLPTRIYGALSGFPPRYADASALSIVLVLVTVIGLVVQRRHLGGRSFVTVSGRGARTARHALGVLRWPLALVILVVVAASSIAPLAVLVMAAFSKVWTDPLTLHNFTLANFYAALVDNQIAARGVMNSFKLAIAAATIAVLLGAAIAYVDLRTRLRGRQMLDYLAILPLGLPGTVLAVALLQAFIRFPVPIYATIWILLIAYVVRSMPIAVRGANGALRQVDASLEEAARVAGASWLVASRRILLPIMRSNLMLAWLLVFIPALGELSATILLYTNGTETMSVAIFRLSDLGQLEVVAALSTVLIAVILVATLLTQSLAGRSRDAASAEAG